MAAPEKPVDLIAVRLGEGLRGARDVAGVTKAELARRLKVPPNYIYRWEIGDRRLDHETILEAERLMGVAAGTVFRLAGYVDDGNLLDLGSLSSEAQRAIRAILREFESVNDDGAGRSEGPAELA